MGNVPAKTSNELIMKRRKKRFYKRSFILMLLLCSICITLCLKLPYFGITEVDVIHNVNITKEEILQLSQLHRGNNIFYVNLGHSKQNILSNPYILNAVLKRSLPNRITINVTEREATFYGELNAKKLVIDKNAVVLEARNDISQMKLTKIEGLNFQTAAVGKQLKTDNPRKLEVLKQIAELILSNQSSYQITLIDVSNILDLKIYYDGICVKLGNEEQLKDKVNKALNILEKQGLHNARGYIDVSFHGNPVFFTER